MRLKDPPNPDQARGAPEGGPKRDVFHEQTSAGGWWQPADGGAPQPERREATRAGYGGWVSVIPTSGESARWCEAVNLSVKGTLLVDPAEAPLPVGTSVEILFSAGNGTVQGVPGSVVRHEGERGYAVSFDDITPTQRKFLERTLNKHRER